MKILASVVLLLGIVFGSQAKAQTTSDVIERIPLGAFDWTRNERLPLDVGKFSPMFRAVILSMQRLALRGTVAVEPGGEEHFYVVARPHFPIRVTFGVLHDIWRIQTSRSDPKEGPDAPFLLEIEGKTWKLKSPGSGQA